MERWRAIEALIDRKLDAHAGCVGAALVAFALLVALACATMVIGTPR